MTVKELRESFVGYVHVFWDNGLLVGDKLLDAGTIGTWENRLKEFDGYEIGTIRISRHQPNTLVVGAYAPSVEKPTYGYIVPSEAKR